MEHTCPDCGAKMKGDREQRENGTYEWVWYCTECGNTVTE